MREILIGLAGSVSALSLCAAVKYGIAKEWGWMAVWIFCAVGGCSLVYLIRFLE